MENCLNDDSNEERDTHRDLARDFTCYQPTPSRLNRTTYPTTEGHRRRKPVEWDALEEWKSPNFRTFSGNRRHGPRATANTPCLLDVHIAEEKDLHHTLLATMPPEAPSSISMVDCKRGAVTSSSPP